MLGWVFVRGAGMSVNRGWQGSGGGVMRVGRGVGFRGWQGK